MVAAVLTKVVTEVAEVCDEVDEAMLEEELERRVIARFGEPYLMDAHICEAVELELRAEGYGAARGDDGQQVYSLPYDELQRRMADGELALPGEQQMAWDQRILRDRLARGVPLGAHLTQLHQLLHEPRDPITNHDLANYGGWWPLGAELSPPSPPPPPPPFALPPAPPADHPCRCTACGHILPIFGCNDGCACMYTDPEALARHKFRECSPACTPRWSQALVNVAPGSAEPCAYCTKYAASRCLGVDDFPNQELLQPCSSSAGASSRRSRQKRCSGHRRRQSEAPASSWRLMRVTCRIITL